MFQGIVTTMVKPQEACCLVRNFTVPQKIINLKINCNAID